MKHARLQWIAIALPALLVGAFEFVRHRWLEPYLPGFWGNLVAALVVADNGRGFDPSRPARDGYGLAIMRAVAGRGGPRPHQDHAR